MIKKIFSFILILMFVFVLQSCNKNGQGSANNSIMEDASVEEMPIEQRVFDMSDVEPTDQKGKLSIKDTFQIVKKEVNLKQNEKLRYDGKMIIGNEIFHNIVVYEDTPDGEATTNIASYYLSDIDETLYKYNVETNEIYEV